MFSGFGRAPDHGELQRLRQRVGELEMTLLRQQQTIDLLASELGVEIPSPPASLRRDRNILHPEVVALLRERKEIAAIKRHRELTGAGLVDAKTLIDQEKGKYL